MKRLLVCFVGCIVAAVFINATGCKNKKEPSSSTETQPTVTDQVVDEPVVTPDNSSSTLMPDHAKVKIKTKFGDIVVALYNETPLHRDNFIKLAGEKYFDGLIFHRCIRNFMIQGGDPNSRGAAMSQMLGGGGPGYTVPAEFRPAYVHKKGALCAARQGDQVNPKKESSGSQFYIVQGQPWTDMQLAQLELNIQQFMPGFKYTDEQKQTYKTVGGTAQLDMNYTVFGEVISGLNIVDSIASQPTARGDRPLADVIMNMEVIQKDHK